MSDLEKEDIIIFETDCTFLLQDNNDEVISKGEGKIQLNKNGKATLSCWQYDYTNPDISSAVGLNEWTYIAVTFGSEGAKFISMLF